MVTDVVKESKHRDTKELKKLNDAAYRFWRDNVSELLHNSGYEDESDKWDHCCSTPKHRITQSSGRLPDEISTAWVCSQDSSHGVYLFSPTCDNRVCPDCSARHSARLLNRYITHIEKLIPQFPKFRLKTIVFTRHVELGELSFAQAAHAGFEMIQKTMRIAVGKHWNKDGRGMLINWEVGTEGKKLHYHCIYFGDFVKQSTLSEAWKSVTVDSYIVWIEGIKMNDGDWQVKVMYTLKYATKFYKTDPETNARMYLSPELTFELFKALKGTRRIRSYGSLFKLGEVEKQVFCCDDCESRMVRIGNAHWQIWLETGFLPDDWNSATRYSSLHLSIANNSDRKGDKHRPDDSTRQLELLNMSKIKEKKDTHYDYI